MNWTHFLLWIAGIYGVYYVAAVLSDLAAAKRSTGTDAASNELSFSETPTPVKLDELPTEPGRKIAPEMIASGGVVIDNLFKLCKQEAVVYTRSVSF